MDSIVGAGLNVGDGEIFGGGGVGCGRVGGGVFATATFGLGTLSNSGGKLGELRRDSDFAFNFSVLSPLRGRPRPRPFFCRKNYATVYFYTAYAYNALHNFTFHAGAGCSPFSALSGSLLGCSRLFISSI